MFIYKLLIETIYLIQIIINYFFSFLTFFFNTDSKNIKKFFLSEPKYQKEKLALFETYSVKDSILANAITAKAIIKKEKIKLKCFNMNINSFYNPITKFNYNSMNMESIDYYLKDLKNLKYSFKIYKENYSKLKKKEIYII